MNAQILSILAQASALSLEDQCLLNKMLVENIKRNRKVEAVKIGVKFNIGDKVSFDAGRKGLKTIMIDGFSRDGTKIKGAEVGSGIHWTVGNTVSSLRKV